MAKTRPNLNNGKTVQPTIKTSFSGVTKNVISHNHRSTASKETAQSTPPRKTATLTSGLLSPPTTPPKFSAPRFEVFKRPESSLKTTISRSEDHASSPTAFNLNLSFSEPEPEIDLTKYSPKVIAAAYDLAQHAGRVNVLQEDIELACMFAGRISVKPTRRDELEFLRK